MKIAIVAFDIWGFNKFIVNHLTLLGHEVTFINSFEIRYVYKNKRQRMINFLSKMFLNRNIKKIFLEKTLSDRINQLPPQDQILIINPYYFKQSLLEVLHRKTQNLMAYNYDSLARIPLPKNYQTLFSKIFSFDIHDVKQNSFLHLLTNFIYLEENENPFPENKAFMILSKSKERERLLHKIAFILEKKGIKNYEFIILNPALKSNNKNVTLTKKHISLPVVKDKMKNAEILIDLVRNNQTGLSFRIFEAMALHKKIITNNATIMEYDFYNPNNILVINENISDISDSFLNNQYEKIPEDIYHKYTMDGWIKEVFYKKENR